MSDIVNLMVCSSRIHVQDGPLSQSHRNFHICCEFPYTSQTSFSRHHFYTISTYLHGLNGRYIVDNARHFSIDAR